MSRHTCDTLLCLDLNSFSFLNNKMWSYRKDKNSMFNLFYKDFIIVIGSINYKKV